MCADVLEHTPDPVLALLKRLREAATSDATFVISVPNVGHLAVRTMLLFGNIFRRWNGGFSIKRICSFSQKTLLVPC